MIDYFLIIHYKKMMLTTKIHSLFRWDHYFLNPKILILEHCQVYQINIHHQDQG